MDGDPTPPTPRTLRVATWNLDHWKRTPDQRDAAWDALTNSGVDVVLAQEAVPPESVSRDHAVHRRIGGQRTWGSAVVSLAKEIRVAEIDLVKTPHGSARFSMLGTCPGAVIVAKANLPNVGPITFVSAYGWIDTYAATSVLRIAADLMPLFDSPEGEHVILGGDLNLTTASRPSKTDTRRHGAILDVLSSLGLEDLTARVADRPAAIDGCACEQVDCRHLPTFRAKPAARPVQLDYLFATPGLASCCRKLELLTGPFAELSDHVPVLATFDLSSRLPTTRWDADSFCVLIGERHGEAARSAVERLIAWARRKTGELQRTRDHRDVTLDRLPVSTGVDPTLWIQVDRASGPAWQWTCAVHADGRVEVPFQYYRQPPFAAPTQREMLWKRLHASVAPELEPRLNGRPTFPLRALNAGDRLDSFVAFLDDLVEAVIQAAGPASATDADAEVALDEDLPAD